MTEHCPPSFPCGINCANLECLIHLDTSILLVNYTDLLVRGCAECNSTLRYSFHLTLVVDPMREVVKQVDLQYEANSWS